MNTILRLLGVLAIFLALQSCQHNDICTADTPGTPRLVIQFFDYDHPGIEKPVTGFNARAIGDTAYYFDEPVSDTTVALPLRTDRDKTTYEVVLHQDDSTAIKRDTITFTYTTEDEFVSRACGFKSIFINLGVEWKATPNGWIKNRRIIDTTKQVRNERNAPLYIYY